MMASDYSDGRGELAKSFGLGRKPRQAIGPAEENNERPPGHQLKQQSLRHSRRFARVIVTPCEGQEDNSPPSGPLNLVRRFALRALRCAARALEIPVGNANDKAAQKSRFSAGPSGFVTSSDKSPACPQYDTTFLGYRLGRSAHKSAE